GAVDRLVFDGRVPPAVEQEDVAGELQVEADAAGAVTHQEDAAVRIVAELLDDRVASLRGDAAVVFERAEAGKRRAELGDRVDPLAEDDRLTAAGGALFEVGFETIELGACAGGGVEVTDLLEP